MGVCLQDGETCRAAFFLDTKKRGSVLANIVAHQHVSNFAKIRIEIGMVAWTHAQPLLITAAWTHKTVLASAISPVTTNWT